MLTADYTMLSVEDIAKALNISKAAVYKTVKKNKDLQKPIIKQNGRTFISEEGVDYLEGFYDTNIPEALYEILSKENDTSETIIDKENIIEIDNLIKYKDVHDNIEESLDDEIISEYYSNENIQDDNFINNNIDTTTHTNTEDKENISADFSKLTDLLSSDSKNVEEIEKLNHEEITINKEMIGLLKSYVEFLQTECDNKNKQLDNKDNIIKTMQTLLEKEQNTVNAQINVEERCRAIDNKLLDLKNQLNERNENNNKGFLKKFKNLFKH